MDVDMDTNRPGTIPGIATATPPRTSPTSRHPRRPLAHQSVSLRHSPPAKLPAAASTLPHAFARDASTLNAKPAARDHAQAYAQAYNHARSHPPASTSPPPASDKANPPSSVSPRLHTNQHSSGESSDAAGWFERTNNDGAHDASFDDRDSPFLLNHSSSSDRTPPEVTRYAAASGMPPLPYRHTALLNHGTDGSSTEDFRSVIDDLTIANKRLKQRLRKYEKVYDAHLQDDKLFEVRFHGLPDHKKKELEDTLRNFAAGLDDASSSTDRPDISYAPVLPKDPTASSTSRFAESGYASMSASGRNSSTPSNNPSNNPANTNNPSTTHHADSRKMTKSAYSRQQQSIHSYLHDIPQGLLPQHNTAMSDKARKKIVVRRLEQIFAGKRSVPGSHPHPMQQEEVAQSAATADRREREATGRRLRPEGLRTALIMPERAEAGDGEGAYVLNIPAHQRLHEQDYGFPTSGSGSPDQRPTRPLDLDPFRAQVPAANMEYFQHLGFSPPNMITADASEDGHGWIYLNLLINMAQLHTLNVTPDNVKDALAEYSTQLEISSDGRKIRWKGGHDFSKNSSEGSPEQLSVGSPYQAMGAQKSPMKGSKAGHSTSLESGYGGSEHQSRNMSQAKKVAESNKFAYKPLFFRKESSESDLDLYDPTESTGSLFQPQQRGDSSGLGSSAVQSSMSSKRRDDGPMIFYNRAKFCTDLTGDRVGASLTLPENYKTITSHPLGAQLDAENNNASAIWEPRGPLDDTTMDVDSKSGAHTPSTAESLGFSPADLQNHSGAESPDLMDFEASGLGGVHPQDNFSIRVQRSQVPTAEHHSTHKSGVYPFKIQAILSEDPTLEYLRRRSASPRDNIKEKLISAVRHDMPSSALPPPSFYPFDSASSGDISDDEDESSSGDSDGSDTNDGPSTALQLLKIAPPRVKFENNDSESSSEASQYSEDDDESIDLLATARQQDPDTVRAFEREYDAAVADRLADEIVAGSSAATAGGGSGFNSPASKAGGLSRRGSARKNAQTAQSPTSAGSLSPRSQNLKRARATESIAAVLRNGSKASKAQRTE